MLNVWFAQPGVFGRPDDRAGQQIGVGRLRDARRAARKPQRFAQFALHGRINAHRADHVHRTAERKAADDLRAHDRIGPAAARARLDQMIFLIPVEVRAGMPGLPFASRNPHRRDVGAVRLRSLQQRHVAQRRLRAEHGQRVDEHRGIRRDLLRVAPSGDQFRFFVQRGVDHVRDIGKFGARERAAARVRVGEVQRHEPGAGRKIRLSSRDADDLPVAARFERVDDAAADQTQRAEHDDFLFICSTRNPSLRRMLIAIDVHFVLLDSRAIQFSMRVNAMTVSAGLGYRQLPIRRRARVLALGRPVRIRAASIRSGSPTA